MTPNTQPRPLTVAPSDELRGRVVRFICEIGNVKRAAALLEISHLTLARLRDGAPVTRPLLAFVDAQLRARCA